MWTSTPAICWAATSATTANFCLRYVIIMILSVRPSAAKGKSGVPSSKSHSIRAVAFASLASGKSVILNPLDSADALSAVSVYGSLGAEIQKEETFWSVEGFGARPRVPEGTLDVGNSGTTCRMALGTAALLKDGEARFDGDSQTRKRPMGPLLNALSNLGAKTQSGKDGYLPVTVGGPWRGGRTKVDGTTSQFTSSLLLNAPFGEETTAIEPIDLNERPYVEMTLWWLDRLGLEYERDEYRSFTVTGGQALSGFNATVPADWSSAAFLLAAGALPGGDVTLEGLDLDDSQGDKEILRFVQEMGARTTISRKCVQIQSGALRGGEFDLNATPDLLPVMAVLGAFADGETRLVNTPQARIKETDRISAMREVIKGLGGEARELADGIVIQGGGLKGGAVHGFGDHRIVMSAAVAGIAAPEGVSVDTAEAMAVTFPDFCERMSSLGADIEARDSANADL